MKSASKILIIANSTWSLRNFRFNLMNALQKNGEIKILANQDEDTLHFKEKNYLFEDFSFNRKNSNLIINLYLIIILFFKIKKYKPNIIFSFGLKPNLYSSIVCKILKIRLIPTFTGLGTLYLKQGLVQKIIIFILKIFLNKKQITIFHNRDDANIFRKWKLVSNNFLVTPGSGVNLSRFRPNNYDFINKKINFIMISRLIRDKGVYEFVEAAKLIKAKFNDKVTFKLVGNVDTENYSSIGYEELNKWKKDKIIEHINFTDDVRDFIISSHCLILPSYREGSSKIIMEAQALSRPVIATDVTGCKELVKNNYNGYLCKARDGYDLFLKIEQFINLSLDDKKQMSINAQSFCLKNFNENNVIKEYINIMKIHG